MNQTKPSNGPADVRLSATAAAVLKTLRDYATPVTAYDVYLVTPSIPYDERTEVVLGNGGSETQRALRELIDAGLVVATERDGETVYSLAPERPARPYTDAQRDDVFTAVTADSRNVYAVYERVYGRIPAALAAEILADLVADGDVIREVRGDAYVYRLAIPPEPPLTTVSDDELWWLRLIEANPGLRSGKSDDRFRPRVDLVCKGLISAQPTNGVGYTLTDLGRRVLAAAETSA